MTPVFCTSFEFTIVFTLHHSLCCWSRSFLASLVFWYHWLCLLIKIRIKLGNSWRQTIHCYVSSGTLCMSPWLLNPDCWTHEFMAQVWEVLSKFWFNSLKWFIWYQDICGCYRINLTFHSIILKLISLSPKCNKYLCKFWFKSLQQKTSTLKRHWNTITIRFTITPIHRK